MTCCSLAAQALSFPGPILRDIYICDRLIGSLRLSDGNCGFQPIEYVPYPVKEILDHESRFHASECNLLDGLDVLAQVCR